MRRFRIILVAAIATTVLMASAQKFAATKTSSVSAPPSSVTGSRAPPAPSGLGAGPPPMHADDDAQPELQGPRMLHGNSRHTHRGSGRVPQSEPIVAWSRELGGPIEAQVVASPDGQTLYVASLGGTLTALASTDGSIRWSVALGDRSYATPCVGDDGTVFVGSDARKLIAVSPDGAVKWSLDTDGDADTGPVIAGDGNIVFAAGRTVMEVSARGQVAWRFAAKRKVFTSPAIGFSGRIFFGSQDHHAYALSPAGQLVWSRDLGADVDGAPALGDDGAVFIGTDADDVVRLDPDDGHIVWRARTDGYVRGTISVARNGDVLAGVYGPTPRAVRLRASDGARVGDFAIQGTGARDFGVHGGALEDAAGALLFGAQDDSVYAVGETGKLLWRVKAAGDVDAPITLLSDSTMIVGSDDGFVRALRERR